MQTMFGIGNTIGAGVFALTGLGAQYAGDYLLNKVFRSESVPLISNLWSYFNDNSSCILRTFFKNAIFRL